MMADISQTKFPNAYNFNKCFFLFGLKFHWSMFRKFPTDNKSVLVQVMAWHQTGAKPLPEPMMNYFTDAYMRH